MQKRVRACQSIQTFCAEEGISKNTYFYWQRKLREAACAGLAQQTDVDGIALVPNGWAQLAVSLPAGSQHECAISAAITIEINGCRVTVSENANMAVLARVCHALSSL